MLRNAYVPAVVSLLSSVGADPLELWAVRARSTAGVADAAMATAARAAAAGSPVDAVSVRSSGLIDDVLACSVVELRCGLALRDCFIALPARLDRTLELKLPHILLHVRRLRDADTAQWLPFAFELCVLDHTDKLRRLHIASYASELSVGADLALVPLQCVERDDEARTALPTASERASDSDSDGGGSEDGSGAHGWRELHCDVAHLVQQCWATTFVHIASVYVYGNCRLRRVFATARVLAAADVPTEFRAYVPPRVSANRRRYQQQQLADGSAT